MKCKHAVFSFLLLTALLALAFALVMGGDGEVKAEREGPQSAPPADGDWIINTTGNRIIDETIMFKIIPPPGEGDPTFETYDNSVVVHGNLTIEEGGELTLLNATLTFDDQDGDG